MTRNNAETELNLEETILKILDIEPMTSIRLKKLSESKMGRSVSFKTYSKHLTQLLAEGMITIEHDKGRGSTKKYAISNNGSKRSQLGLSKSNPHYSIFKQMYVNLFFRDITLGTTFATNQLEHLLNDLEISKNQLEIQHIEENHYDQSQVSNLESPYFERRFPVYLTIYYKPVGGAQIEETIEYREHIYYHSYAEMNSVFQYTIPGMSINDFINKRHRYKYVRQRVERMFDILHKLGIIRTVGQFRGETRYIITDVDLLELIHDINQFNHLEKEFNRIWITIFDVPDKEQLDKMKLFYPDEKSMNTYLMKLEIQRYQNKKELVLRKGTRYFERYLKRGKSLLDEYKAKEFDIIGPIKKKHDKTIQKYEFMSDILSSVCPMLYG
jgi:hypothetical protein